MTDKQDLSQDSGLVPDQAIDKEKLEEIIRKDEAVGRSMSGPWGYLLGGLGIFMVLFYFYQAGIAPVDNQYSLGFYVSLTYIMIFISYPATKGSTLGHPSWWDIFLCLVTIITIGYWMIEFEDLNYRMGAETDLDTVASVLGILLSLEAARRVLGMSLTIAGVVFLLYSFWGDLLAHIPVLRAFSHTGFSYKQSVNHIFLKSEGVFGIMADVLVTYVILFIFFGSFLKKSGAARFFLDLPLALAGRSIGGPAKVAVIASGFFGSVSGSAIANTVSTGSFTIPLMKKAGFRPHVAGAIEPAASIGGMFMPPIMGAGGFIMSEMTGVPYVEIMKMAVFPAVMYFLSVYAMIHFEAKRYGLRGERNPGDPTAWQIFKKEWYMSAPLVIIVVLMLVGFSPSLAAFWATLSCLVVSWLPSGDRMGFKEIIEAMTEGARNTLVIGAAVGVIGIIVGTIALTGIGLKFSAIIIDLSGGFLPLAILLIGLASLVLGMGVPVTAAYLITAVLTVSAVSNMIGMTHFGMPYGDMMDNPNLVHQAAWVLIASHMIVYWFSQDSNITPPVCVAAYAGAAIAGSDPWKTGWTSFKFAKMLYLGPFLFAYSQGFLLYGTWDHIIMTWVGITLGTWAFGALTMGYMVCPMKIWEWAILAVGTILLFFPRLPGHLLGIEIHDAIEYTAGIALWVAVFLLQKIRVRRDPSLVLPLHERHKMARTSA